MALSRIWSAFILVAILTAGYSFFFNKSKDDVFIRMVSGTAKDEYKYAVIGDSTYAANLKKHLKDYSFVFQAGTGKDTIDKDTRYLVTENAAADTVLKIQQKYPSVRVVSAAYMYGKNQKPVDGVIETCWTAVDICLKLIGILSLFIGFMNIAEKAGGIRFLSRIVGPFFTKLFPEIPKGHPSMGHMIMNFSANLLGLDNAATPFGLKAMESLQELNPNKETASNSQIMFLCLHAAGLNLIPVSVIAVRAANNASDPTDVFLPCMIVTFAGTLAAMIIVSIRQKINLLQPIIFAWIFGISAIIALLVWYITKLNTWGVQLFSGSLSNGLILLVFLLIVIGGLYKKVDVFSVFVDGAKSGFDTAIRIIPYILGILVAVSMLRTSGTFDVIINGIKHFFAMLGADTKFVDGLPTALIRPLSGGAARGMMVDTMKAYGPDSFASRLSGIFQGAADTTFYVVAVYFGSVNIKNTRYSIGTMLLADLVGVLTAIAMAYKFFG
ncbi:nucleoside recognition domain-containing protein [Ferruginibacter sp.]